MSFIMARLRQSWTPLAVFEPTSRKNAKITCQIPFPSISCVLLETPIAKHIPQMMVFLHVFRHMKLCDQKMPRFCRGLSLANNLLVSELPLCLGQQQPLEFLDLSRSLPQKRCMGGRAERSEANTHTILWFPTLNGHATLAWYERTATCSASNLVTSASTGSGSRRRSRRS